MKKYEILGDENRQTLSEAITKRLNATEQWDLYGPPQVVFDGQHFHFYQAMIAIVEEE